MKKLIDKGESKFTGGLLGLIGIALLTIIITVFTLGLAYPWAVVIKEKCYANNTIIDGQQMKFVGKGGSLFGHYIKWFLLTIITFGIYAFWLSIKMKQWVVNHTTFIE